MNFGPFFANIFQFDLYVGRLIRECIRNIFLTFFHEKSRIGYRNWSWHGYDINHFHLVFGIRLDSNPKPLDHESSSITTRPDSSPDKLNMAHWFDFRLKQLLKLCFENNYFVFSTICSNSWHSHCILIHGELLCTRRYDWIVPLDYVCC